MPQGSTEASEADLLLSDSAVPIWWWHIDCV